MGWKKERGDENAKRTIKVANGSTGKDRRIRIQKESPYWPAFFFSYTKFLVLVTSQVHWLDRVRRREKESKQRRKEEKQKRRGWLSKARMRRWRRGRRGEGSYVIHAREGTDLRLDPRRSSRFTCRRFRSSISSRSFLRFSSVSLDVERYEAKLNYADGRELQRYSRESTRSDHITYVVRFLFFFSDVQVYIHVYVGSKCGSKSQFLSSVSLLH